MRRVIRIVLDQRNARYGLLRGYFHGADDDTADESGRRARLHSVTLPLSSDCDGQTLGHQALHAMGITVVSVRRASGSVSSPSEDLVLNSGDTLVLSGCHRPCRWPRRSCWGALRKQPCLAGCARGSFPTPPRTSPPDFATFIDCALHQQSTEPHGLVRGCNLPGRLQRGCFAWVSMLDDRAVVTPLFRNAPAGAVDVDGPAAPGRMQGCGPSQAQGGPPAAAPVSVAPAVSRSVPQAEEFTGAWRPPKRSRSAPAWAAPWRKSTSPKASWCARASPCSRSTRGATRPSWPRPNAQLNAARTAAELAGAEEARANKLLAEKAISQQEAEQLSAGQRNAKASVLAAQAAVQAAALNVEYSQIRAPITGVTSRAQVTAGNLVAPGETVLTTLVSQDKVYAYFDVPEQIYLRYTQAGAPAQPPVNLGLANETGYPRAGVIDFFDNRLNPATGGIRARAVFDNADHRLIPGLFARLKLTSGTVNDAVLVPERAIGTDQSKRFVWVVGADKMPQFRAVTLGSLNDGMRIITQGLKPGEQVVVSGLQRVRPGMPLNPEVLPVDEQGRPIERPPALPGAAPASVPAAKAAASAPAAKP